MNERMNRWMDGAVSDGATITPKRQDKLGGLKNHQPVSQSVNQWETNESSGDASASKEMLAHL